VRIEHVRIVVLAAGRSERMGFDKLTAAFAGEPLARRVIRALHGLEPTVVATAHVAGVVFDLPGIRLITTRPTAGPRETLALAHAATPGEAHLAVLPCDLPFLDAARVRAFVAQVPGGVDLAWPVVAQTPGHPVIWSPKARARIQALRVGEAPLRVRDDPALRTAAIEVADDAYVTDVDTPEEWASAELRAR
jgi:CTP:molybdopterin cytidylyltransferase MocA